MGKRLGALTPNGSSAYVLLVVLLKYPLATIMDAVTMSPSAQCHCISAICVKNPSKDP